MSLQTLSCNPEASRAGDGKAAVHGSAVNHGLGAGCRARKQDRLTVGCLVLSMMCVDSHGCPRVLWWKTLPSPMGKVSPLPLSHSLCIIISLTWKCGGCRPEKSLSVLPEAKLRPKK